MGVALAGVSIPPAGAESLPASVRLITVSGTGVTTYPGYTDDIDRFAIRTTEATDGSVVVTATSSDPGAVVRLDGRRVPSGEPQAIQGLAVGDEVSVQIADAAGVTNQSLVYLPADFPTLTVTHSGAGPSPGGTFLTLGTFGSAPRFEAIVDEHGVPVYASRQDLSSHDLKRQPNGHYSVARAKTPAFDSTYDIVELDEEFQQVASHTVQGHPDTDFHDSILLPGGGRILLSEQLDSDTGLVDAVVQEVGPNGSVLLNWNSADHVDPAIDSPGQGSDYVHVNSLDITQDGNLLVSFRHTSQIMKINRVTGAVIWRLGGIRSDFTFVDDPEGGPCAQHTATELANGDIQIYDNGAVVGDPAARLCPDPVNPDGPRVDRGISRVAVYDLDTDAGTATLTEEYRPGLYSPFAGSVYRLGAEGPTDRMFVGTSAAQMTDGSPAPLAIEATAAGETVWSLAASGGYFSYRSMKFDAPDVTAPEVSVVRPAPGAVYDEGDLVIADLGCTDTGGSVLRTCGVGTLDGDPLPMTPGSHALVVPGVDGAGNTTTITVPYRVRTAYQPDTELRGPRGAWVGAGVLGSAAGQSVTVRTGSFKAKVFRVRVTNTGVRTDSLKLKGRVGNDRFQVRYLAQGRDVTAQVVAGTYLTDALTTGATAVLKVRVRRLPAARRGAQIMVVLTASSAADTTRTDAVAMRLRGPGR